MFFDYKRLRDGEEAKDLINELFLTLWTNHQGLFLSTSLPAYLYSATRNRIINFITHKKIEERYINSFQHYLDNTSGNTIDHLARHNEMSSFIEAEIAALAPRMRLVFELSRKTNLTRKEIAEQLNISEETVKAQMHNALRIQSKAHLD
jgi:RNA polymerase sigma factor (sigma-70 family)